jgi:uncharacterized membrane protein YhaH (DUF805 family)
MSPSHPAPAVPGPPPWGPPGPSPLDRPQYDATPAQAVARFWRKYTVFSGRASRSEFWWWYLVSFVVSAVLGVVGLAVAGGPRTDPTDFSPFGAEVLIPQVWSVLTFVGMVALSVRRLHDSNRSGWWYLLTLPGVVSSVLMLVVLTRLEPEQLAVGNVSSLAVGPLVVGMITALAGLVCTIVLIVFYASAPDHRGMRFDPRP